MADSNQKPYTNKSTSLERSQQCPCELSGLRPCPLCETKVRFFWELSQVLKLGRLYSIHPNKSHRVK